MTDVQLYIKPTHRGRIIFSFLILLLFTIGNIMGQSPILSLDIEKIRRDYKTAKEPHHITQLLYDHCLYFQERDYKVDSVIHYAHKLLDLGKASDYPIASISGHRILGSQYTRTRELEDGRRHLTKAIQIAKHTPTYKDIYDIYNPLAKNYDSDNKLDSALHYFTLALREVPKEKNSKICNIHLGIGNVYNSLGRYKKQEEHVKMAHEYSLLSGSRLDMIIAYHSLLLYYSMTSPDATKFNKYKISYDSLSNFFPSYKASYHYTYLLPEELESSKKIEFLNQALIDNKEKQYTDGVYYNYLMLQREYNKTGEYAKSLKMSTEALAYKNQGKTLELDLLVELYKFRWVAESNLEDPKTAFQTVAHYHYLKDSLEAQINAKHINDLSIKYETAKKDAELSAVSIKANHRTAQRNYALLGGGILLTFGFFLWRRSKYRQQKIEAENKLQAEQISNLENEKKILSLAAMIEGQEAERTRIAQDLHDGLGGLLSSVRNHFSLIHDEVKKLDQLNVYDRTNTMIDQACNEVRRISHNLMPASLQLNGLVDTIDQYCRDVDKNKQLSVEFEHTGLKDNRLTETSEIFIYRIIQEAVTNVLKHANATNLLVQLGLYKNEITLIIEDDGVGFDTNSNSSGIGLKSITSRVEHLGGLLDIDSKINSGTTLTINIPYEH